MDVVEVIEVTAVGAKARKLEGRKGISRDEKLRLCRTIGLSKCTYG